MRQATENYDSRYFKLSTNWGWMFNDNENIVSEETKMERSTETIHFGHSGITKLSTMPKHFVGRTLHETLKKRSKTV